MKKPLVNEATDELIEKSAPMEAKTKDEMDLIRERIASLVDEIEHTTTASEESDIMAEDPLSAFCIRGHTIEKIYGKTAKRNFR